MDNLKYLEFLQNWKYNLPTYNTGEIFSVPESISIVSTDLVNGFCKSGFLYSDRNKSVIGANINLLNTAISYKVNSVFAVNDCHTKDSKEFSYFSEHCLYNSNESNMVIEFNPLIHKIWKFKKNSISSSFTGIEKLIEKNKNIIITGVCTDICVYQIATYLLAYKNENNYEGRIIIPENCVATYDSENHPGDLYHLMFLYNMHINGIKIVKEIV
jgi:nicotinamidase-related amidase